jgi:AcrR family transcriptional regulator
VSLRAPYEQFGSKAGIVQAILLEDIDIFAGQAAAIRSQDPIDYLFDRLDLGIAFYRSRQPFYRALSRAGHAGVADPRFDPERLGLEMRRQICRAMAKRDCLLPGIDPNLLAETLNDIFFATLRNWAFGDFDIELVRLKAGFGSATILAGATVSPYAERLQALARDFQRAIAEQSAPEAVSASRRIASKD